MPRGHKNAYTDLTAEFVRELFDYDEGTGWLLYRQAPSNFKKAGERAGTRTKHGRIRIIIEGRHYLAHRIIWLWKTGAWPEHEIDHWDEDPGNNRWKNIRKATSSQNLSNRGTPINNTSGFKGVWKAKSGSWYADIQFKKIKRRFGPFITPQEAAEKRNAAAVKLHGQFAKH